MLDYINAVKELDFPKRVNFLFGFFAMIIITGLALALAGRKKTTRL